MVGRIVWIALLLGASAESQVPIAPTANRFPLHVSVGAIAGQPERVRVGFDVFFPAEKGRYLPVDQQTAELLSSSPEIRANSGWGIKVLKSVCTPKTMRVETGSEADLGVGGRVEIEVEITPGLPDADGRHEVLLAFPMVDLVRTRVRGIPPASPAEMRLQVKVWATRQAKLEDERRIEAERQRLAKETRARLIRIAGLVLLAGALIVGAVYSRRRWLWPSIREQVAAGEVLECRDAFLPWLDNQAEAGTIVATAWARTRMGRRCRIKVELFTPARNDEEWSEPNLVISVGVSVHPGSYLAKVSGGAVLVEVVSAAS